MIAALLLVLVAEPFRHDTHLGLKPALECQSCHAFSPETVRPGKNDHAPCDSCHAEEYYRAPGAFCQNCHLSVDPTKKGSSPLVPYPRRAASNDIAFSHASHQAAPCSTCHDQNVDKPTPMKVCASCHDDASVTSDAVRIKKCSVCHLEPAFVSMVAPLITLPFAEGLEANARAPASAPPAIARAPATLAERRPSDHTPMFRTRHEQAARDDDNKCNYCHQGISGSHRDACNDCHATMRPRSHGLRFQGPRHGRVAAESPAKCATCHETDFCTACHDIPPPSHFPISSFLTRHSLRARTNARSCLTCHTFESTCERCHGIGGAE